MKSLSHKWAFKGDLRADFDTNLARQASVCYGFNLKGRMILVSKVAVWHAQQSPRFPYEI